MNDKRLNAHISSQITTKIFIYLKKLPMCVRHEWNKMKEYHEMKMIDKEPIYKIVIRILIDPR